MSISFRKIRTAAGVEYYLSEEGMSEAYYSGSRSEGAGKWLDFTGNANVSGTVESEDFRFLSEGYDPKKAKVILAKNEEKYSRIAKEMRAEGASKNEVSERIKAEKLEDLKPAGLPAAKNAGAENRVKGFDLTLSPPKDVSTVWAVARANNDEELTQKIEAAQDRAVQKVAAFVNQKLILARRGQGGETLENANGLMAAFGHFTSREGDPDVHTHLVIQNLCQRMDGTWGALETSELLRWQGVLEGIYHTELAAAMVEECGFNVEIEEGKKAFKLAGMPDGFQELCDEWSKRRAQFVENAGGEEAARQLGRAAEEAAFVKDRASKTVTDPEEQFQNWQADAAEKGITLDSIKAAMTNKEPVYRPNKLVLDELFAELRGELTDKQSTFTETRFIARFAFKLQGKCDSSTALQIAKDYSKDLVVLGRDRKGAQIMSTPEMVELEQKMVEDAKRLNPKNALLPEQLEKFISQRATMTEEQANAVRHVCYSPRLCSIFSGAAGSGKSFSSDTVREALEASGKNVVGLALSWKAADVMRHEASVESARAIAGFLADIDKGKIKLDRNSVILIDEAGLVDSRSMAKILRAASESDAKVILTGDTRQLLPVQAGGALNTLATELGEARIDSVRRQRLDWQKEAGLAIALGDANSAVKAYAEAGNIKIDWTKQDSMKRLVEDWRNFRNANPDESAVVIATTRREVSALNEMMRDVMRKDGVVTGPDFSVQVTDGNETKTINLAVGDRIQYRKNSKDDCIYNRTEGTITAISDVNGKIKIDLTLDDGRTHSISTDKNCSTYDQKREALSIDHAWAMTCYSSQGQTKEQAFLLHNDIMDRRLAYVGMTRHKGDVHVYADRETAHEIEMAKRPDEAWTPLNKFTDEDVLKSIAAAWSRNSTKTTTVDFLRGAETDEQINERHRLMRYEEAVAIESYRSGVAADRSFDEFFALMREQQALAAATIDPDTKLVDEPKQQPHEVATPESAIAFVERYLPGGLEGEGPIFVTDSPAAAERYQQQQALAGRNVDCIVVDREDDPILDHPTVQRMLADRDRPVHLESNVGLLSQFRVKEIREEAKASEPHRIERTHALER